jgi:ribosomal subunit interface protein
MSFRVSGKNIDVGDALRARVDERIREIVGKYFDRSFSGHVTVSKEGAGFRTECAIHLESGKTLHVDGYAGDAYASADQSAMRIEKRLRRYKGRLKTHPTERPAVAVADTGSYILAAPDEDLEEEAAEYAPSIIAESTTALETLSVSEAVIELDLTGAPVVIFRHAASGRVNVVYRRGDGNIGWIDPPAGVSVDSKMR